MKSYPEPETEYEYSQVELTYAQVRAGDKVAGQTVDFAKVGSKWTELRTASYALIARKLNEAPAVVARQQETQASRARWSRWDSNKRIVREIAKDPWARLTQAAGNVAETTTPRDGYPLLGYGEVANLLEAQAKLKVQVRWRSLIEHLEQKPDYDGDHVQMTTEFVQELANGLLKDYRHKSLSRSTSVVSNLMEDCDREAEAAFIDEARWWGVELR